MKWKRLDLRKKEHHPPVGAPVALMIKPKDTRAAMAYRNGYDAGTFELEGGKLWLRHSSGVSDPACMNKRCDIWWCPLPEFDGF